MNKNTNFGKTFAATATLALLLVLISASASAQSTNKLDVNVSVADQTIIDIQPSRFAWGYGGSGINPGEIAGPSRELNGYGRIQVENLGSVNISQIWFNTTAPSQRPFGTANRNNYDSANFIQLSSNKSSPGSLRDDNAFVGRTEYGLDQPTGKDIIYLNTPSNWDYGRFRNGSYEYFWTVDDTAGLSGATFRIGYNHHDSNQTGSTNLDNACSGGDESGSANCNGYSLSTSGTGPTYAYTEVYVGAEDTSSVTPSSPGSNGVYYCAVMQESQITGTGNPKVQFIKWNPGHPGVQAAGSDCGTVTQYLIGGSSNQLAPGDWTKMNIRANIPYGVVSGNVPTGQLTVLATSN